MMTSTWTALALSLGFFGGHHYSHPPHTTSNNLRIPEELLECTDTRGDVHGGGTTVDSYSRRCAVRVKIETTKKEKKK